MNSNQEFKEMRKVGKDDKEIVDLEVRRIEIEGIDEIKSLE